MLINSRSHIKFNSPMFFFSFYYLIAHLFIFFMCAIKCASLYWGIRSFLFLLISCFITLEIHTSCQNYIHLTFLLQAISFLSHIKRSFYNIDKLDVCSGGGSFISNVTSTYFNFRFDITLITVRTFKVWCYNWLITFVHNLLSFFPSILAADY